MKMMKTATIILAAGKGTRMRSDLPKVVFEIAGEPMINRVITTARQVDSERIIVVIGYKKEIVQSVIPPDSSIRFAVQDPQNGTGHAIMVCRDQIEDFEGVVFILYGDVPLLTSATLKKMYAIHLAENSACTVLTAVMEDPLQYGRIVRDANGAFEKIVEHKDATEVEREIKEINTGIYCYNSQDLLESVSQLKNNNSQNEYYLTDTLEILAKQGRHISTLILADNVEATGVNSPEQLKELERELIRLEKRDNNE
ncbi:MAG: NTP transferase domain-containing protein [Candidatus Cloacimonetes bacterium]|nr:NTP transferase domain-containing protein [Candidatus Cloacimonadota bacterium]